ncbi:hypothetical protein Tsubulata_025864 [Turnera subulata]|uniref:Uncharacterized protein n=1 Tax=Turnera subulata TaxID=218843 RepID=A0A9Q0F3X1_9ROSI|nr:hypothetical protein Tsubulata_025864 [Turnera subulata]
MGTLKARINDQVTPAAETTTPAVEEPGRYSHRSIETLVVVLTLITIIAVIAGIIARLCGGRHFGSNGEHDIEGWVESKCRSCIDGGIPAAPAPPPEEPKPATEEAKK